MTSKIVIECQLGCKSKLQDLLFLGYVSSVNSMRSSSEKNISETFFPLDLLICPTCKIGQISCIVDKEVLFPQSYPYTSSTTKILRKNFKNLAEESLRIINVTKKDLILDIGSNDGNLLINFKDQMKVLGITPENVGKIAIKRGITTIIDYFNSKSALKIIKKYHKAKIITATNVFAHIDQMKDLIKNIKKCLTEDGVFISESHYFLKVIEGMQYDTIYHEHLRYYSLTSLKFFLEKFGLEIFHAKEIETHGGSIRVYASRKKNYSITKNVSNILKKEKIFFKKKSLTSFKKKVLLTKLGMLKIIENLKNKNKVIYGVGAPSRSSTLINYVGLDENMIDCILEVNSSHKIGKYVPGTKIPVLSEDTVKYKNLDYLLLFSWHIKDDLKKIFRNKGFKGKFIIPLPAPRIEN